MARKGSRREGSACRAAYFFLELTNLDVQEIRYLAPQKGADPN